MRLSFWIALGLFGCGDKDDSEGVVCEEGSIAIHGECVVGGSGSGEGSTGGGGDDDSDTTTGGGSGGTTGGGGVSTDATIEILTPETGTVFTDPWVNITFKVDGCNMSAPSADPGGCHIHRTINGMAYEDPDTVEDPGGWGHYSTDPVDMYLGEPGGKNIRFVLIRNDGSDDPFEPEVSDLISVIIQDDSEPDTGDDDTAASDTGSADTGSDDDTASADTASEDDGGDTEDGPFEGDDPGECDDGADNDRDGLFDCDDPDCYGAPVCADAGDDDDTPDTEDDGDTDVDDDDTSDTEDHDDTDVDGGGEDVAPEPEEDDDTASDGDAGDDDDTPGTEDDGDTDVDGGGEDVAPEPEEDDDTATDGDASDEAPIEADGETDSEEDTASE